MKQETRTGLRLHFSGVRKIHQNRLLDIQVIKDDLLWTFLHVVF